jgi:hypothetical protein
VQDKQWAIDMNDEVVATALLNVLGGVNWQAVRLARGFLALRGGATITDAAITASGEMRSEQAFQRLSDATHDDF